MCNVRANMHSCNCDNLCTSAVNYRHVVQLESREKYRAKSYHQALSTSTFVLTQYARRVCAYHTSDADDPYAKNQCVALATDLDQGP